MKLFRGKWLCMFSMKTNSQIQEEIVQYMYSTGTVHVWTDSVFLSQTRLHYKVSNVTTLFVLSDLFLSLYLFTQKTSCTFCVFLFSSARSSLRHNAQPAHASSIFHSAQHQGHNLGSKNLQHDQRNATHAEHVTHTTNKQIQQSNI